MLSIVIPVHAQSGALRHTLVSLSQQSVAHEKFEVIVVDDASPRPAAEAAGQVRNLTVHVDRLERNCGRAAARNAGVRLARGEHILFLDADSVAHRDLVRTHLELLGTGEKRAVLGRRVYPNWATAQSLSGPATLGLDFPLDQDDTRYGFHIDCAEVVHGSPWFYVQTHNFSAPREALDSVGGFDENFRSWGWEDTELAYRLFLHWGRDGTRFVYAPGAVCFHVPHFANTEKNWLEASSGLRYLKEKHPHFDVERLGIGSPRGQVLSQATYTAFLLRPDDSPETVLRQLEEALPTSDRRLWAGRLAHNLSALPSAVMDCTLPATERNKPLVGIHTPWADDSFDDVVHWDNWRILTPGDLSACIVESLRLAPVLYLAGSATLGYTQPVARQADLSLLLENSRFQVTELPEADGVWITEVRNA